jgi:TRAP-type C4-dicarboxylate transport system substrate-binding protein
MSPEVLVMSRHAWDSLSDEDKTIFREAARESNRFMREQWSALEEQSRRKAEAAGTTIVTDFPRQTFQQAMAPVYENVLNSPALSRLVDRIREVR